MISGVPQNAGNLQPSGSIVWGGGGDVTDEHNTRAIRKVTSGELLTKQSMRKQILLYIKMHTYLTLLLIVVTAGIEELVVSGNTFLYACVKEVCRLSAQPLFGTFYQLFFIVETLCSHPLIQVGKLVVVARSEIRALRRVFKPLPVEMPRQCSSANSCRSTAPYVSIPRFFL
jgi:hypothetical protein